MSAEAASAQTTSAEECKSAVAHSARALAATPSQSLAGIVESIVRPILTTPTLTEEVQPYYCAERTGVDQSKLSPLARLWIFSRGLDVRTEHSYSELCGLDWDSLSVAARVAATTASTREDAVNREVVEFTRWLEENLYVTVAEQFTKGSIRQLASLSRSRDALQPGDNLLRFIVSDQNERDDGLPACDVYEHYRLGEFNTLTPLSHPALLDMVLLASAAVSRMLMSQVLELSEEQEKQALDAALVDARESARKRRKL